MYGGGQFCSFKEQYLYLHLNVSPLNLVSFLISRHLFQQSQWKFVIWSLPKLENKMWRGLFHTSTVIYLQFITLRLACKQALQGAPVAVWEKEEELVTTSLESEYLHGKSRCKMLIGRDDISNDVITLGTGFSMFVYIHVRFHFALIGGNLTAQSMQSYRGMEVEFKFQRSSYKLSILFSPHHQTAPES